ncbi:MAG: rRNA maturation RNase YbeY [Pseudomonadota bacterium]
MIRIEAQIVSTAPDLPSRQKLHEWVVATLSGYRQDAEVVIRIVDEEESARLNEQYRGKQGPTNILSFPFEVPPDVLLDLLGDLVICAPVVAGEARAQTKSGEAHWAHMVVHGVLHLLGFDHLEPAEAERMENEEIRILGSLGIASPYEEELTR